MSKFNIVNKNRSNAYATVRLNKEQIEAIKDFMNQKDSDDVKFPSGVVLVHQSSGHYRFWAPLWNEDPTQVLVLAIRIASKALYEHKQFKHHIKFNRPVAYVNGVYVGSIQTVRDRDAAIISRRKVDPAPTNTVKIESLLGAKFRLKTNQRKHVS